MAGQQRVSSLLTQKRVFRVAVSTAARPSASVLSVDTASRSLRLSQVYAEIAG